MDNLFVIVDIRAYLVHFLNSTLFAPEIRSSVRRL